MKRHLSIVAAGLVLALALGACQGGKSSGGGGSVLPRDALAQEFLPLAVAALEQEKWYPTLRPRIRTGLADCLALQTAKVVGSGSEKAVRATQAQARIAAYIEQLNQRDLRPFDRTCPEIIFEVEQSLPLKRN